MEAWVISPDFTIEDIHKKSLVGCASVRKDVLCSGVMEHSPYSEGAVYMDAAPLPIWHEQIEGVVLEESQAYFKGDKTPEDVAAIIQNRVQLFLDE